MSICGFAHAQGTVDPLFVSSGTWGQATFDQWGLRKIGFTELGTGKSGWEITTGVEHPVIVAVIDTGIDYFHPDLRPETVWRNPNERANGIDDDGNGYVDDLIGWNFVDGDNNPWDRCGHGTHVSGVIAAWTGNGEGIAGVNLGARIMSLKVLNFIGRGRSSGIASAIYYATENGARVINLSVGSKKVSQAERQAVEYAHRKGVVIVVASGNTGSNANEFGMAGIEDVITVAATDTADKRIAFSNWGTAVDIAAPGEDILSLRARRTDFARVAGIEGYTAGQWIVGTEKRYYRASGTSFAAPFVSGVASLLIAMNPALNAEQVTRMMLQSAKDTETPGIDQLTGYGRLDAAAALRADPGFYVDAEIQNVQLIERDSKRLIQVIGTMDADQFKQAWIEAGKGENPSSFGEASQIMREPMRDSVLIEFDPERFTGSNKWILRLITEHENGRKREARFTLTLG